MTIREAINEVDTLKPNMYGMQEKIKWLSRLDSRIAQDILATHELSEEEQELLPFEGYTEDDIEQELLIGEPYDEMYASWLSAQVDWHNMEFDNFNVNNAMFESVFTQFRNAFNRSHMPKGGGKIYF